eukprot:2139782-Ditylum_brightwellii.AAC.1
MSCICWSKGATSKGIRHIQIYENTMRKSIIAKFITIAHCDGKTTLADLFTKKDQEFNLIMAEIPVI